MSGRSSDFQVKTVYVDTQERGGTPCLKTRRNPDYFCDGGKVKVLVVQSWPTLCDLIDCSQPGSSVHGILQARILEWVPIPFSRDLPIENR